MPATQEDFEVLKTAFIKNNVQDLKNNKDLHNFDVTATDSQHGWNYLMFACIFSSAPEVMKFVLEKIDEAGGPDLFQILLTATDSDGSSNCLHHASVSASSPEGMKLVVDKAIEVGGTELLQSQLINARSNTDTTCLMFACFNSSCSGVTKLVCKKIVEVGGLELLKIKLAETDRDGKNCLMYALLRPLKAFDEVIKLLAALLCHFNLFEPQYAKLDFDKKKQLEKAGVDPSWTRWTDQKIETIKVLFSDIKCVGGDQFLKEVLSRDTVGGESYLLSVCLHLPDRLEFFLETIQEVGGEEFLAEQISTKRPSDGMSCLYALCKYASNYESLALLVSKILQSEFLNRRFLHDQLIGNPCLNVVLSRPLDSLDETKILCLIVSLYSMTGLFEDYYRCLAYEEAQFFIEEKKEKLRRICNIEFGHWSRATSNDSTMGDTIGEIKKSIMMMNKK